MVTAAESLNNGATALNDAVAAYTALTDAAQARLDALADWQIADPVTYTVGTEYATLQDAWDQTSYRQLKDVVTIQMPDGVNPIDRLVLADAPYGSKIRIIGNIANPAACVLDVTAAVAKLSEIISVTDCAVEISGFTLRADDPELVVAGLRVLGGRVFSQPNSLVVEGCGYAIIGDNKGRFRGDGVVINGCILGLVAYNAADVESSGALITCVGRTYVSPSGLRAYALHSARGGQLRASSATVSQAYHGLQAHSNGIALVPGLVGDDLDVGIEARLGGYVVGNSNLADSPVSFTNVNRGIAAYSNGTIECPAAVVDGAVNGFLAQSGGYILAPSSTAKNCTSYGYSATARGQIDAGESAANASGNGTDYNLTSGSPGATGGLLNYT